MPSIIPEKGEERNPKVLPTKTRIKTAEWKPEIDFWGTRAVVNIGEYLYNLAASPFREASAYLSMTDYLGPKIKALGGKREVPKEVPEKGGDYRIGSVDALRKYTNANFVDRVLERAYADMERDTRVEGKYLQYVDFDDSEINGHEDGANRIQINRRLSTADKLVVLAHERRGHGDKPGHVNGEPYGIDYRDANAYVLAAAAKEGFGSAKQYVSDLFKNALSPRVGRSLANA